MNDKQYTSNMLCHFVGRSQPTDEDRYNLLVKIITKDSALKINSKDSDFPITSFKLGQKKANYNGEIFEKCDCVCFCDIPDESLDIHRNKYSSFGIGFEKNFLISQGTRPVMYVPKNCEMREAGENKRYPNDPEVYYNQLEEQICCTYMLLYLLNGSHPFKDQTKEFLLKEKESDEKETIKNFIINPIENELDSGNIGQLFLYFCRAWTKQCEYIKIFDDNLTEEDPENYYMEREWRCINSVHFSLNDIKKIYLPNSLYLNRFKMDVPDYKGDFFVFDHLK